MRVILSDNAPSFDDIAFEEGETIGGITVDGVALDLTIASVDWENSSMIARTTDNSGVELVYNGIDVMSLRRDTSRGVLPYQSTKRVTALSVDFSNLI